MDGEKFIHPRWTSWMQFAPFFRLFHLAESRVREIGKTL